MEDYQPIIQFSEELAARALASNYPKNDVRIDFFNLIANLTYQYYLEQIALESSALFKNEKLRCTELNFYHKINDFVKLAENEVLAKSYLNSTNRGLLIDSWSSFEVCLSSICDKFFSEKDKLSIQSKTYNDVEKCLNRYKLDEDTKKQIEGILVVKEFWLTSTNSKFTKLLSLLKKNYCKEDLEKDREFLLFLNKFRNTIHSNNIYFGNDEKPYIFDCVDSRVEFRFDKGGLVKYDSIASPFLFFRLIVRLTEVYTEIISHLGDIEFIPYPDIYAGEY